MAKQTGVVRISGKVGNLTFAQSPNGDEVRLNTSLTGEQMRTERRFKRTRENWNEFSKAGNSAKLIRDAFASITKPLTDRLAYPRLFRETLKVVKSDPTSARGQRLFHLGDLNHLLNYDFNVQQPMSRSFRVPYTVAIDRAGGTANIVIPDFVPEGNVAISQGATHFKVVAAVAEIDWLEKDHINSLTESIPMVESESAIPGVSLDLTFDANTTKTIMVALGLWYYQEVNGVFYQLADGSRNAMALVGIDHV